MNIRKRYPWEGLWHFMTGWEELFSRFFLSVTFCVFVWLPLTLGQGQWCESPLVPALPSLTKLGMVVSCCHLLFDRLSLELHPPQQALLDSEGFALFFFFLYILFIYFLERRGGKEKEGEKHPCVRDTTISCLSHALKWVPGPQPRHVLWLGIELATFGFAGQHSIHWATPARMHLDL